MSIVVDDSVPAQSRFRDLLPIAVDIALFLSAEILCAEVILRWPHLVRRVSEVVIPRAYAAAASTPALDSTKQTIAVILAATFAIMMLMLTYAGYLARPPSPAARPWLTRVSCACFLLLSAILGYQIAIQ